MAPGCAPEPGRHRSVERRKGDFEILCVTSGKTAVLVHSGCLYSGNSITDSSPNGPELGRGCPGQAKIGTRLTRGGTGRGTPYDRQEPVKGPPRDHPPFSQVPVRRAALGPPRTRRPAPPPNRGRKVGRRPQCWSPEDLGKTPRHPVTLPGHRGSPLLDRRRVPRAVARLGGPMADPLRSDVQAVGERRASRPRPEAFRPQRPPRLPNTRRAPPAGRRQAGRPRCPAGRRSG